jgi:hypothetical protein
LLTGAAADGTTLFAFVDQVNNVGGEVQISYSQPTLDQVFEQYHEVSDVAIVAPGSYPEGRRELQLGEPLKVSHTWRFDIKPKGLKPAFNLKGAVKTDVAVFHNELLFTDSKLSRYEFGFDLGFSYDIDFILNIAQAGFDVKYDETYFKTSIPTLKAFNKALKLAVITARALVGGASAGVGGLIVPQLEIGAEYSLKAKSTLTLETGMTNSWRRESKFVYKPGHTGLDAWAYEQGTPFQESKFKKPSAKIEGEAGAGLRIIPRAYVGVGDLKAIQVELAPFVNIAAKAEVAQNSVIAGLVGPAHVTDMSVKTGIDFAIQTQLKTTIFLSSFLISNTRGSRLFFSRRTGFPFPKSPWMLGVELRTLFLTL